MVLKRLKQRVGLFSHYRMPAILLFGGFKDTALERKISSGHD
jgi:hypothetical protein